VDVCCGFHVVLTEPLPNTNNESYKLYAATPFGCILGLGVIPPTKVTSVHFTLGLTKNWLFVKLLQTYAPYKNVYFLDENAIYLFYKF
jgi:hypothetical protein